MALPILALVVAAQAPEVSARTLIPQMWDFTHLTRPAAATYTAAQASSYDRASDPGPNRDWFANGDAGKFLRVEEKSGHKEYVMADLKGPGAVVRVWSANPTGVLRFYFDGESNPRLEADCQKLLTGGDPRFPDPFSYMAAQGTNLYFPLPYAKSLKVTVDDRDGKERPLGFYYQVNYRTYAGGTPVKTFEVSDTRVPEIVNATAALKPRSVWNYQDRMQNESAQAKALGRGKTLNLNLRGAGTVRNFRVKIPFPLVQNIRAMDWDDAYQPHNILRTLILRVDFDGKRSIETPLGDFFGSGPGLVPYKSLAFEVLADGTMICRLPMPFMKGAKFSIRNDGRVDVPVAIAAMRSEEKPAPDAYRLHAQWLATSEQSRPFKDLSFLDAKGEGYWLGSMLHVSNPTPAWWGEGDEKVYVDGEAFPSTFGTGTEDYYGYAWCSPEVFARPYHAQPRCDGPANFGQTSVNRFHILDPIPYKRSIKFDMERWHWQDVPSTFARTVYWYAKPGGTAPVAINRKLLLPPEMTPPKPIAGAQEGEKLEVLEMTGGQRENQTGFWELSSGYQLWWREVQVGNRLKLKVNVKEAGTYEVIGNLAHAADYGIHRIKLNGKDLGTHDFYGQGVTWKRLPLGTVDLPKGDVELEIECVGANGQAKPGRMFGLDYLLLNKK